MKNYSVHILSIFAIGFLFSFSETLAQDLVPLDPYSEPITTIDKIDKEFFWMLSMK